jgi:hypothetical protein
MPESLEDLISSMMSPAKRNDLSADYMSNSSLVDLLEKRQPGIGAKFSKIAISKVMVNLGFARSVKTAHNGKSIRGFWIHFKPGTP